MDKVRDDQPERLADDDKQIWIEDESSHEGEDGPSAEGADTDPSPVPKADADDSEGRAEQSTPNTAHPPLNRSGGTRQQPERERLLARLAAERPHLIPLIQRNESLRMGRREPH